MHSKAKKRPVWSVYLIRTGNGHLYTGITTDVQRRIEEHRNGEGKGAKWLRGRGPLRLEFQYPIGDRSLALRVENRIKRLPRVRKQALIERNDFIHEIIALCSD